MGDLVNFKRNLIRRKTDSRKFESEHSRRLQLEKELCHSKLVLKETTLHQQFIQCQLNKTQAELKNVNEVNKTLLSSNK